MVYIRLGVDAILTNYPANAFKVLMEDEFKDKYRLAGHDDDPWQRFEDWPELRITKIIGLIIILKFYMKFDLPWKLSW